MSLAQVLLVAEATARRDAAQDLRHLQNLTAVAGAMFGKESGGDRQLQDLVRRLQHAVNSQ